MRKCVDRKQLDQQAVEKGFSIVNFAAAIPFRSSFDSGLIGVFLSDRPFSATFSTAC
jgi:hypothetical protein